MDVTRLQKKMKTWSSEEFLQYFVGTILLAVGLMLLSLNTWSFSTKMFFHSHVMDLKLDITFFSLPALSFCLPCFFLNTCLSFNRRGLFYTLVGLDSVAIIILIAGYVVGTKYQPKFSNVTLRLDSTIPKQYLNYTLYHMIINYENDTESQRSLDRIQNVMECCGAQSDQDYSATPASCCPKYNCQENTPYVQGCLRPLQEDIAWHRNITISLCQLGFLMFIFDLVMIVAVYLSYYYKWKARNKFALIKKIKMKD